MVVPCLGEEEAHCKGAEVTVWKVLVRRDLDEVSQISLQFSESCKWKILHSMKDDGGSFTICHTVTFLSIFSGWGVAIKLGIRTCYSINPIYVSLQKSSCSVPINSSLF